MNTQTKSRVAVRRKNGSKKKAGRWGRTDIPNMIERSWEGLGSIRIELAEFRFAQTIHEQGPNTWRQIPLGGKKPSKLVLEADWVLEDGVEIIHAFKNRVVDGSTSEVRSFEIPITWQAGQRRDSEDVPVLPGKGERDFQLYLINRKNGFIVHVDVTVVSRKGMFWLIVQEVTGAQIVQHDREVELDGYTSIIIGDNGYSMVPVYNENCYPGFDPVASWNRSYAGRADKVLGYAVDFGAYVSPEDCAPGEWQPEMPNDVPAALKAKGYSPATVEWFNLTAGFGFVQLKDGQKCFVHFTAIQDENGKNVADQGDFPALQPMRGCYVKWQLTEDKGEKKPKATAVRPALAQAA